MSFKIENGYTFGVIAAGTMGTAVLNAVVNAVSEHTSQKDKDEKVVIPSKFLAGVNTPKSVERLEKIFGSKVAASAGNNNKIVEESDVIILGCKPFMVEKVLGPIPNELFKGKIIVSLLAGTTIEQTAALTGNNALVVRAMTNTPSKIGAGMTVLSYPESAPADIKGPIGWIFEQTGRSMVLDEKYMDVATALCGSGPAFCFLMIEALSDGAVKMGMPYPLAQECAAQVLHGASQMVLQGDHPAVLRNAVCTPGGTTIGGLSVLEKGSVRSSVAGAVEEATNIATRLSKK